MMKPNITYLFSVVALALSLSSCGGSDGDSDNQQSELPQIQIVYPLDTVNLSDSIDVKVVYSDNSGLTFTELSLGTQSGGNTVYHNSQRGLAGLNDELEFQVAVPNPVVLDIKGTNYILVKCRDEDGNEQIKEKTFIVRQVDTEAPQVLNSGALGVLSSDPNVAFEVAYQLSDNIALDRMELSLIEWNNNSAGNLMYQTTVDLGGAQSKSGIELIPGQASFVTGQDFRVRLLVFDKAGNRTDHYVISTFTVI
jgi:hypothetical protein